MIHSLVISMPIIVCAVFAMLMLLDLRGRRERNVLAVFFIVATLLYIGHGIFFCKNLPLIPLSDTIYSFCNLAVYPLYYLYIESITSDNIRGFRIHKTIALLPAVVCSLTIGMFYLLMNDEETKLFIHSYLYEVNSSELTGIAWWQAVAHMVTKSIFALQIIPVVHFGSRSIMKFNQRVEASFADIEGRSLHRQKVLLWIFLVTSLASFVCNIIGRQWFDSSAWLLSVPSILFSALLFCVGREGFMQNFSIQEIMEAEKEEMPNEEEEDETVEDTFATGGDSVSANEEGDHPHIIETNSSSTKDRKMENIVQRIVDEQLYLQPDLQLNGLATLLGTNRTYISEAIRKAKGMTFYEFINDLRIQHAQKLMKEHPEMAIYEIYTQSGYSNYPTFRRNFVKFSEQTID
ncbi:MAG: AraC family transcriptional regulator [Bacteroidaceae bacterium]|nr:AraC family transcriptional regulator [Bacteroidaceae bacterium]